MAVVHWGDVHMAGKRGRPMLHEHTSCGHTFDPVLDLLGLRRAAASRARCG